jgi:hypothetical protein
MKKKPKTFLLGRDSKTGEFVPAEKVYKRPERYTVQKVSKSTSIPKELKYVVRPKSSRKKSK